VEAREQLLVSEALFPEDPTFKLLLALVAVRQRNQGEVRRLLEEMRGQLGQEQMELLRDGMGVWQSITASDEAFFGPGQFDAKALAEKVTPLLKRFLIGEVDLQKAEQLRTLTRMVRLPPTVARGLWEAGQLAIQFGLTENAEDRTINEVKRVVQIHREGTLYYIYASMLLIRGRFEEAVEPYRLAVETPSLLPIQRLALDGAIMMEGWVGSPIREKPNLDMRRRAADHLRQRIESGPIRANYFMPFCKVAVYADDVELARRVLGQWQKQTPSDVEYLKFRATVELKAGAYGQAITAANRVLDAQPKDLEASQLLKEALEKYRQEGETLRASTGKMH
jgi:tetratricopeptide (TPR) repeat protein